MGAPGLRPVLGTASATLLVVGSIVGSGIFLLPSLVAKQLPSAPLVLLAWLVGGLCALAGALTFAELGAMLPRAGGQYVYLREAFGRAPAFLFGWMTFSVNYTGTIAAVAVAFAIYLSALVPLSASGVKLVAIALIWTLTLVNLRGIKRGATLGNVATIAKVAGLLALVAVAFALAPAPGPGPSQAQAPARAQALVGAFALAVGALIFAYDGFASATFVAGEMRDPARSLPRACVWGVLIVTLVYLATNAAYLRALGPAGVAASEHVATDAATAALGSAGGVLVTLAVLASTFGLVNGYVLQAPRISYAAALDGATYRGFASLNRQGAPDFALLLQAEWASLLALWGSFDQLVAYVTVSSWIFFGLTGVALLRLRRTMPHAARPFRTPTWVAWAFVVVAVALIVGMLVANPRDALIGIGLVLTGVPFFWLARRTDTPRSQDTKR